MFNRIIKRIEMKQLRQHPFEVKEKLDRSAQSLKQLRD